MQGPMKVAISPSGSTPDALIHRLFGRAEWFLVFEEGDAEVKAFRNRYAETETGAGIGCAQDLVREGVEEVISGQVGPKAYEVLSRAGVKVYVAPPKVTVREAYEKFRASALMRMEIRKF